MHQENTKEDLSFSKSHLHLHRLRQRYDVFISFRGEDTRNTLTGHLYEALRRRGIVTFKDDQKLEIGDTINDELMEAIEQSSCSIILLSQRYASSKWCLRELAKIVDCMYTNNQRVFPVFYHVLRSDVQMQSGNFKEDFEKHEITPKNSTPQQEKDNAEDVRTWKAAMEKVGNLPGKEVNKDSNEMDVVAEIVKWVFDELRPKAISRNENLVGVDSSLHCIDMLLALSLRNEVRFVAIVGMGGIGKTAIAELIHDRYAHQFESSCFLRVYDDGSNQRGVLQLQQQLLSELLLTQFEVWDENNGAESIRKRLVCKRVLLVIDGIEEDWQLEKLADSPSWFGPGSRVIITTRNKRLIDHLNKVKMFEYDVLLLDRGDALKLFKNYAADCVHDQNFIDLSNKVLEYAGGLPLALESLGVALRFERVKKWENIRQVGEKKILKRLRICCSAIETKALDVFLDIACFFNGRNLSQVIPILESCGRKQVLNNITLLIDRCLMEVSHDKLLMHNLIQEMGRDESLTLPHKHSRIWLRKHLTHAFAEIQGLKFIEEISLDVNERIELDLDVKLFSEMKNLRILEISQVKLSEGEDLKYLSNLLGLLNWPGYPSSCLPSTFQSDYLVQLCMPSSHIKQLWEGKKEVKHCVPFNFPQQEISRWFRHQENQPRMKIKLPPKISEDKKWIGLALFAIFSVKEVNSKTSPSFTYVIESDEQSFVQHSPYIPMPMFLFDNSHQLCVIFEPLVGYLNGRNNTSPLCVSFHVHPEVKIELCGARLVCEHNVEGFVLTILDSILRSGESLHEFFSQKLMESFLAMEKNMQSYDLTSPEAVTNVKTSTISSDTPLESLENGSSPCLLFQNGIQVLSV